MNTYQIILVVIGVVLVAAWVSFTVAEKVRDRKIDRQNAKARDNQ